MARANKVEGLVRRKPGGGSSPPGRIREALQIRASRRQGGFGMGRSPIVRFCANGTAEHFVGRMFGFGVNYLRS